METNEAYWHHHGATRVTELSGQFVDMVRGLSESQLRASVPGLDWSALEVVAHVTTVWRRYTVNRRRAATWADVAVENEADVRAAEADPAALLQEIEQHMALMASAPEVIAPTSQVDFHAGQTFTLAGAWGNAISELLVHGDDVSRAAGCAWTVPSADLEPFWRYTTPILPGFLNDRGRSARDRWLLDFGFESGPVRLRFADGLVLVDEEGDFDPDYVVRGDAADVTLAMPWRRRPLSDPAMKEFAERVEPV